MPCPYDRELAASQCKTGGGSETRPYENRGLRTGIAASPRARE